MTGDGHDHTFGNCGWSCCLLGTLRGHGGAIREDSLAEMRHKIGSHLDGATSVAGVLAEGIPTFTKRGRWANHC
jgi:hypothetical protein